MSEGNGVQNLQSLVNFGDFRRQTDGTCTAWMKAGTRADNICFEDHRIYMPGTENSTDAKQSRVR